MNIGGRGHQCGSWSCWPPVQAKLCPLLRAKVVFIYPEVPQSFGLCYPKATTPHFLGEGERSKDSHNSCLNTAVLHVHNPLTAGPSRAAETQLWQDRAAARQRFRASGQQKAKHQPLLPAGTAASQRLLLIRCSGAGSWAKIQATLGS